MHISVVSVFAFLALIAVIFRFWARMIKSLKFQLDDYLCVVGLVPSSLRTTYTIQLTWYQIFGLASTITAVHCMRIC